MKLRTFLQHRYHQWARAQQRRLVAGALYLLDESHTCWMPKGNRYVEHDIGFKNIRYPDGTTRRVKTTKVRDTGGVTFYSFAADTPLS